MTTIPYTNTKNQIDNHNKRARTESHLNDVVGSVGSRIDGNLLNCKKNYKKHLHANNTFIHTIHHAHNRKQIFERKHAP